MTLHVAHTQFSTCTDNSNSNVVLRYASSTHVFCICARSHVFTSAASSWVQDRALCAGPASIASAGSAAAMTELSDSS